VSYIWVSVGIAPAVNNMPTLRSPHSVWCVATIEILFVRNSGIPRIFGLPQKIKKKTSEVISEHLISKFSVKCMATDRLAAACLSIVTELW